MKTYVLSHFAALRWFLSHRDPRVDSNAPHLDVPASSDAPDSQVVEELRWTIGLEGPLDFLVIGDGVLRRSSAVRPHRCTQCLPPGSLIPMECRASNAELMVCCPELSFLQICQGVDTREAIYFGMCACSDFRFDPFAPGGVVYRAEGSHSIATRRSITTYLEKASGLKGVKRARGLGACSRSCEVSQGMRLRDVVLSFLQVRGIRFGRAFLQRDGSGI